MPELSEQEIKAAEAEVRLILGEFRAGWDGWPLTAADWRYLDKKVDTLHAAIKKIPIEGRST